MFYQECEVFFKTKLFNEISPVVNKKLNDRIHVYYIWWDSKTCPHVPQLTYNLLEILRKSDTFGRIVNRSDVFTYLSIYKDVIVVE